MRRATQPEPIPTRLLRVYSLTRYHAGGCDIRIGRRTPDALFVRLGARSATLVTAWNPLSRRMPDGWNRRMQQRLRERLRRRATMQAEGSLHQWREAMLLVPGDPRQLVRIARIFRQLGIVILRKRHTARLHLLRA